MKKAMSADFDDVAGRNSEPCKDSYSDISDKEQPSSEDIQEAYRKMYDNWLKVCEVNKSLENKILMLGDENDVFKGVSAK